jgi:putative phosphoesterase
MTVVGVISDTHGLLRPQALEALRGSAHILHAGDIGDPDILGLLKTVAPVIAVRGNVDGEGWARQIPQTQVFEIEGVSIYMLHILAELDLKPEAAGFGAVVYGHSHQPSQSVKGGVLYFNPGSAGPRRFKLPVTVGKLVIENGFVRGEIITLESSGSSTRSQKLTTKDKT